MDEPGFLLGYPVYLIGRYSAERCQADPGLRQHWATTEANGQRALMLFTEEIFAERIMMAEAAAGNIVAIGSPAELADIIRRNRKHFTMVLIDPNPTSGIGRGFPLEDFLRGFDQ